MSGIQSLGSLSIPSSAKGLLGSVAPAKPQDGFQDLLANSLQQTINSHRAAESAVERNLSGEEITQVEVLSAVKKADMSLRMLLQIRNKVLEAFNEIKQMQM